MKQQFHHNCRRLLRCSSRCSLSILLSMLAHSNALAYELSPSEVRNVTQEKSPSVLQSRFFLKALRPEIGIMTGTFLNEAYTKTSGTGFRSGLFLSETFGAEFQNTKTSSKDTDDRKALNTLKYRDLERDTVVSPDPEVNKIYSVMDLNGVFAPFYGKLNLLDEYIVYLDLYLTGGYSQIESTQGDLNAYSLGIGQRFYMFKSWSLRFDFRNRAFTERRNNKASNRNALSIDLGASYFFL
jgi:outer membrane beta-barrel protein